MQGLAAVVVKKWGGYLNPFSMNGPQARKPARRQCRKPPQNEIERLRFALAEAIRIEDYEKAAEVRDQLRKLQASET